MKHSGHAEPMELDSRNLTILISALSSVRIRINFGKGICPEKKLWYARRAKGMNKRRDSSVNAEPGERVTHVNLIQLSKRDDVTLINLMSYPGETFSLLVLQITSFNFPIFPSRFPQVFLISRICFSAVFYGYFYGSPEQSASSESEKKQMES